jgi:LmbE family N-acetylglucosaminyl deacetylase
VTAGPDGWVERFRGRRVLALAPHPDDLAFSAGGFLRRLASLAETTVVTVFTCNVWAPHWSSAERDPEAVSRVRQAEDVRYCERVGVQRLALGLADAGLRGYDDESERLGRRVDDGVAVAVREGLAPLLGKADVLLCPLGLGGHVDHEIVRDAAMAAGSKERLLCLYEDLPYASHLSAPEIEEHARRVAPEARPQLFDLGPLWQRKLEDLSIYRTQIRAQDIDDVRAHARRAARDGGLAERLWLLDL